VKLDNRRTKYQKRCEHPYRKPTPPLATQAHWDTDTFPGHRMAKNSTRRTTAWPQAEPEQVAAIVQAASDLSVVIDDSDIVTAVTHSLDLPHDGALEAWHGRHVDEIVSEASRPTLRRMMRLVRGDKGTPRFDVSHPIGNRTELPIRYAALKLGRAGGVALLGRDRRSELDLYGKLLTSRQSLEQSTRLQRQSDAHYRILFESAAAPTIVADADTGRIRDVNPRAAALLGATAAGMTGKRLASIAVKADQPALQALLSAVAVSVGPHVARVKGANGASVEVSAELFRAGDLRLVLLQLSPAGMASAGERNSAAAQLALLQQAPEAIVLTDEGGGVVWANESFLALAGVPLAAHLLGRPLESLFEWQGAGQDVLLQNARRHGSVAAFAGMLRAAHGSLVEVEMSVVALQGAGAGDGFGFVLRPASAEASRQGMAGDIVHTAEGMIELVGRVPLKDLVRDTTDVIEKMCIEAALRLTGNNRASAARALGLSRQAFYLKLARFGITGGD
jgi:transcriptional regulator PpsR